MTKIDPECFLILGLLYCPDPQKVRASVFYSLLQSRENSKQSKNFSKNGHSGVVSAAASSNQSSVAKDELSCMDEHIESVIFKMCILSQMFVEFHALPPKKGRNEVVLLQEAVRMRTTIFFEVYLTFVQKVWEQQEKFYVNRDEFINKMSVYPLKYFLKSSTIR